ncbi:MAG: hypothetical protein IJW85_06235, partial [Clostridia bacterium]|nr:hypothetical protein [Clostridia bacterium]
MKKRSISILCMLLALLLALPAAAEPIVSGTAGYTAYLGENNYLYLTDPAGITKVLQTPIANLIGMTDTALYCTTADGRRYEVMLDGSSSRIMATEPTLSTSYFLKENVLSPMDAAGVELSGIPDVVAACATADALYYVAANSLSGYALMRLPLPVDESTIASGKVLVRSQVSKPVSISVSPEAIAIVTEQHSVEVIDPVSGMMETVPFYGTDLTHAVATNGKLIALSVNENGQYTVFESRDYTAPSPLMLTSMTTPEPTAPAKLSATATPKPTAT